MSGSDAAALAYIKVGGKGGLAAILEVAAEEGRGGLK